MVAAGTDDTMKPQEGEKRFREAREEYEREMDVEQRRAKFEHLMEEKKSKAREAEQKAVADTAGTIEQS